MVGLLPEFGGQSRANSDNGHQRARVVLISYDGLKGHGERLFRGLETFIQADRSIVFRRLEIQQIETRRMCSVDVSHRQNDLLIAARRNIAQFGAHFKSIFDGIATIDGTTTIGTSQDQTHVPIKGLDDLIPSFVLKQQ